MNDQAKTDQLMESLAYLNSIVKLSEFFSNDPEVVKQAYIKLLKSELAESLYYLTVGGGILPWRGDLTNVDLSGTDLSYARFNSDDLSGANLSSANLTGTDLSHANLCGTDLSNTDMMETLHYGAKYNSSTRFPDRFDIENSDMVFVD